MNGSIIARDMQKSAAERSERGHILRVPGCRTWYCDWSVWFLYHEMKHSLKHSSGKASVWNRSGVDDIRFLIFSLVFSLTAPDRFYFLLSVLWRKTSTWHCYYVHLYSEHPRNAQAEPPLKSLCRADRRPLLACWWMLGLWVTDTCLMIHQLVLGGSWGSNLTGWFLERSYRDKWLWGAAHHRHRSLQPSCLLLLDSLSAEDDECLGVGAFFCVPPSEGRPSDVSLVDLPRCAVFKASARPHVAEQITLSDGCFLWNYSETLDSSILSLHRLCSHHAAGKPSRLCTVNFIISLASTWWAENTSLNCSISGQDPSY